MSLAEINERPEQFSFEVRDWTQLHEGLRARAEQMAMSREALDVLTGVPDGYSAKLLGPRPIRHIGIKTAAPILRAIGLKILLVEDVEAMHALQHRRAPRAERAVRLSNRNAHRAAERRKRRRKRNRR
jgi:hypothetical protein